MHMSMFKVDINLFFTQLKLSFFIALQNNMRSEEWGSWRCQTKCCMYGCRECLRLKLDDCDAAVPPDTTPAQSVGQKYDCCYVQSKQPRKAAPMTGNIKQKVDGASYFSVQQLKIGLWEASCCLK